MTTEKPDWLELIATVLKESPAARKFVSEIAGRMIEESKPETRPCPGCGHENHPDAPFCFECGRDVDTDHPHHWYCIRCGRKNGPASIACGRYGCNLERKTGQGTGPDPFQGAEIPQSPVTDGPSTK